MEPQVHFVIEVGTTPLSSTTPTTPGATEPDDGADGGKKPRLPSPQTADHTNIAGLATTLGLSALVAVGTLVYLVVVLRRKRASED